MSTVTFDTLKFVTRLEQAGLPREQATALAEAQREVFAEALNTTLATKADVVEVKSSIAEVKAEQVLQRWMLTALIAVAIANFAKQYF
jgi:hypothetical protein